MKRLMDSNIYDTSSTIVIVGSCLKNMQPEGFEKLKKISSNIYELCLEETHVNMAITKVGGTLPEKLPTPDKSIRKLSKEIKNKDNLPKL